MRDTAVDSAAPTIDPWEHEDTIRRPRAALVEARCVFGAEGQRRPDREDPTTLLSWSATFVPTLQEDEVVSYRLELLDETGDVFHADRQVIAVRYGGGDGDREAPLAGDGPGFVLGGRRGIHPSRQRWGVLEHTARWRVVVEGLHDLLQMEPLRRRHQIAVRDLDGEIIAQTGSKIERWRPTY